MADFARHGGIEVEVATIEAWDPAGRTFDAVIAGQAWHWVDPIAGAAKAARVLRPGGRLAVFWNVAQPPPEATDAFAAVYQRVAPEAPAARAYHGSVSALDVYAAMFTKAADGIRNAGAFGDPEQWRFDWAQTYTTDEWLDLVPTHGGHHQLPPATRADLLDGLGATVDAMGGRFTMQYATVVVTAARTGDAG
jgi:SAM-dependent methyltransferase